MEGFGLEICNALGFGGRVNDACNKSPEGTIPLQGGGRLHVVKTSNAASVSPPLAARLDLAGLSLRVQHGCFRYGAIAAEQHFEKPFSALDAVQVQVQAASASTAAV